MEIILPESYGYHRTKQGLVKAYNGEVELIIKDRLGNVLYNIRENNIIKIDAKEIISHRLPYSKVWDPTGGTGSGAWATHNIDIDEFAPKYIVFGASFDDKGNPLDTADTRFYSPDKITGGYVPVSLGVGAEFDGGLINAVPISEPGRPLKRVERIFFEPSYQPAGTPLLQADVRAMNNTVVFETTLQKDEYNGFGVTTNDFFTLTEVALVGAAELGSVGACECDPRDIFLTGNTSGEAFLASANGTATVNLSMTESQVDAISEGDRVKIVLANSTAAADSTLDQVDPYYLVIDKAVGGRDITLDRTPVDSNGTPITGDIGLLRDGWRLFSARVLAAPVRKSIDFQIVVRWRIQLS